MVFVKGQSGNPAGKPVGTRSFTTKVREALEKIADGKDYSYEEALVKSILKKGIVDGDSASQRLIWNYLDGMPMQKTEITGADGKDLFGNDETRNKTKKAVGSFLKGDGTAGDRKDT